MRSRSKPRVLLAEDDPLVREIVRLKLGLDYRVTTADTGPQTLEAMIHRRPQVTVLDINLPGLNGFEVLEALHEREPGYDAPVIMLTARHSADDVRRALALGARDYVVKTEDVKGVVARIERVLRQSAAGVVRPRPVDL